MTGRSAVFLAASAALMLTACETRPQTAFDGRCWIRDDQGRLTVLDSHVENIETCGARLAVRQIQQDKAVSGVFGGFDVYVDADSMTAGTPYPGHRILLVSAADRKRIDAAIRGLLATQPVTVKGPA